MATVEGSFYLDRYADTFLRARQVGPTPNYVDGAPHVVTPALATDAGPNGVVLADVAELRAMNAGGTWWDDHGTLGKVVTDTGADVSGATMADWIEGGYTMTVVLSGSGHETRLTVSDVTAPPAPEPDPQPEPEPEPQPEPSPPSWIETEDVAAFLSLILDDPTREKLEPVTGAAIAWVQRCRPDLDPLTDPGPAVRQGTIMYAALLFQQASSPSGLPTFDDLGQYDQTGASMGQVYRLIGYRRPVVV